MLGLKYPKSGLSAELSESLSVNEVLLMLLGFFFFKHVFITSHELDGTYGVRGRGVEYGSRNCGKRKILYLWR